MAMDNHMRSVSKELTTQEKMAQGSAWMTMGNIGSRLLGAIYILPWYYWMGANADKANALFGMGYNVYALFLMISTAGIPSAIAKQISFYNSRQEYRTSQKLFLRAFQLMAGFGVVTAGIMYLAAPWLATASGGGAELIPAMRSLSIAGFSLYECHARVFPRKPRHETFCDLASGGTNRSCLLYAFSDLHHYAGHRRRIHGSRDAIDLCRLYRCLSEHFGIRLLLPKAAGADGCFSRYEQRRNGAANQRIGFSDHQRSDPFYYRWFWDHDFKIGGSVHLCTDHE